MLMVVSVTSYAIAFVAVALECEGAAIAFIGIALLVAHLA